MRWGSCRTVEGGSGWWARLDALPVLQRSMLAFLRKTTECPWSTGIMELSPAGWPCSELS